MEKEQEGDRKDNMTKLLSLVWYKVLPARFGGQKGIAEFNRYLSVHFPLTCLCSSDNTPAGNEPYELRPELPIGRSQVLNPFAWRKIVVTAKKGAYTHLILEHPYYGLIAIWLKKRHGIFLISHSHNIEFQRFREMNRWWWPILRWLEGKVHRNADLNLYKTENDLHEAIRIFGSDPKRCMVLPYGLTREKTPDESERHAARERIGRLHGIPDETTILYFNGTLDYFPNAKALRWMVKEMLPLLNTMLKKPFRLLVTGRNIKPGFRDLEELRHDTFIYAGLVEDVADYYLASDIFLSPVNQGGGIKVKVLEALSWGLTVVCSPHSAEGIDIRMAGSKLHIGNDDVNNFCIKIAEALTDPGTIPKRFFDYYHWSNLLKPVVERISASLD